MPTALAATSRPGPTAQQTLAWNTEGDLSKLTEGTKETSYLYDANGDLLIRRAKGDGETVLYLGADTELHLTTKGTTKTASGTRSYTANGQTIAVRTATSGVSGTKLSFLAADQHGTSSNALDASTYAVTKRYSTPFGAPRGTKPTSWPDDKAFLGKPADGATGLTHVGAREYDPTIGQFISVDPLLTLDQHQSLNGYSYANNTPVTSADPTGLCAQVDCPTRPGPGYENNTPGTIPHKPRKSANTIYKEEGLSYNGSGTASTSSSGDSGSVTVTLIAGPGDDSNATPDRKIYAMGTNPAYDPQGIKAAEESERQAAADFWNNLPCAKGDAHWQCEARRSWGRTISLFGPLIGLRAVPGVDEPSLVKVYRVDGEGKYARIKIKNGYPLIKNATKQPIFLNFGNESRATSYLARRVDQYGDGTHRLVTFEVDREYLNYLRNNAVPERMARRYPDGPLVVDRKYSDQYGLRPEQTKMLFDNIIPGTAREEN
ncbi:RHS repeat domain-containing protein [Streptomyces guryensis]|uniref:RHS repeat domain-containing protein n=1 Tax=Streptomyces guryensis TaxID=2886947 RepID=UPI003556DDA3